MFNVATWNLCLGLKNKKDIVYGCLVEEKIDIALLQEVDIVKDFPLGLLTNKDYRLEIENSKTKSRCAIAIKNNINYTRRQDLEGEDLSLVIIDVTSTSSYRIVNVYRQFNPPDNLTQTAHFDLQLKQCELASRNLNGKKLIICGDFNMDDKHRYSIDYRYKNLFALQNAIFENLNLIQLIKFPTWKRIVNNTRKESTLDHIYVQDPLVISNVCAKEPLCGDHVIIIFKISGKPDPPTVTLKRNWQDYSPEKLIANLSNLSFDFEADQVQAYWNKLESLLLPVIDNIAPITPFKNNVTVASTEVPDVIKRKLNLRKRLLKSLKTNKTNVLRDRVNNLNVEIKRHFLIKKTKAIRRKIMPGNSKSLWHAVNIAKDANIPLLPTAMTLNNELIDLKDLPDTFAQFFQNKVSSIVNAQSIDQNVYNGITKLVTAEHDFMTESDVLKAVISLKNKTSEGHDRIPVRVLKDGISILIKPLTILFNKIYIQKSLPEQWLISKTIPIFKKGDKNKIENYRPISNLCSCSKIFEKLILFRIQSLEHTFNIDLTGKSQHGFKRKHSTATAGLQIQTLIARAADGDMYSLMASLDLSAAFDVVNVELLLKRLKIMGLPPDIINLLNKWLNNQFFYVSVGDGNSFVYGTSVGTVQGSILGPVLYALFVSPLLDLEKIILFADDNYVLVWNKHVGLLKAEMERKLGVINDWLRNSGLKVNETKTELCLFHRKDNPPIEITLHNQIITSKPSMNVLGVAYDSKLNWNIHITNCITKANKALHAIKIIRRFFTSKELLMLITSNYYSILYYNSEIWHLPSNTFSSKKQLLAASAKPLKLCTSNYDFNMSYDYLHTINKRATPLQYMKYSHAILLHKLYNSNNQNQDWLDLFTNQTFNARNGNTHFVDTSNFKIGKNIISNRLNLINDQIKYEWLNLDLNHFKLKCKSLFLSS